MGNTFCKIKDPKNNNIYVLMDENKQPLSCSDQNKCIIMNIDKVLNNPNNYTTQRFMNESIEETNIPCTIRKDKDGNIIGSDILTDINIDNYRIATIDMSSAFIQTSLSKEDVEKQYYTPYSLLNMGYNMTNSDVSKNEFIQNLNSLHTIRKAIFKNKNLDETQIKYNNNLRNNKDSFSNFFLNNITFLIFIIFIFGIIIKNIFFS